MRKKFCCTFVLVTALHGYAGGVASAQSKGGRAPIVRSSVPAANLDLAARPIRERRKLLVAGELSFNGLLGLGANVGYQFRRYFALDAGLGLAAQAQPKVGLRARFELMRGEIAPFVALGATFVPGTRHFQTGHTSSGYAYRYKFNPAVMALGMVGVSVVMENGFTFLGGLGFNARLSPKPVYVEEGRSASVFSALFYDEGPSASVAWGYSFK